MISHLLCLFCSRCSSKSVRQPEAQEPPFLFVLEGLRDVLCIPLGTHGLHWGEAACALRSWEVITLLCAQDEMWLLVVSICRGFAAPWAAGSCGKEGAGTGIRIRHLPAAPMEQLLSKAVPSFSGEGSHRPEVVQSLWALEGEKEPGCSEPGAAYFVESVW